MKNLIYVKFYPNKWSKTTYYVGTVRLKALFPLAHHHRLTMLANVAISRPLANNCLPKSIHVKESRQSQNTWCNPTTTLAYEGNQDHVALGPGPFIWSSFLMLFMNMILFYLMWGHFNLHGKEDRCCWCFGISLEFRQRTSACRWQHWTCSVVFCILCLSCILHISLNECKCALSKPQPSNLMQLGGAPPPTFALVLSWICSMSVPNYRHLDKWIVLKSPSTLSLTRWLNMLLTGYINIILIGIRLQPIPKFYIISRCNLAC